MFKASPPIGEIVHAVHQDPSTLKSDNLRSRIENLVGLISSLSVKTGVENASKEILNDLFELRLELLSTPDLFDYLLERTSQTVDEIISEQLNKKPSFLNLEKTYISSLNIYRTITSSFSNLASPSNEKVIIESKPSYSDFNSILMSLPSRESHLLLEYIETSLMVDYAFITSDLVLSGEIELPAREHLKLIELLKDKIEVYGAFAYIYDLWTPSEDHETQWERNIKIISSRIQAEFSLGSLNTFSNLSTLEDSLISA